MTFWLTGSIGSLATSTTHSCYRRLTWLRHKLTRVEELGGHLKSYRVLRSCAPVKYLIQTLVDLKVRSCRVGRSNVGCKTIPIGELERRLRFEHPRGLCRVASGAFG